MILPEKNLIERIDDIFIVKPESHFNNVFSEKAGPTLFGKHNRHYLLFLNDDPKKPTVYQVRKFYNHDYDDPVELRLLTDLGASRIMKWVNPMLEKIVSKAEKNIEEKVKEFYSRLETGDVFGAKESAEKTKYILQCYNTVDPFEEGMVILPVHLYSRLSITPDKMLENITDSHYEKGILFYKKKAVEYALQTDTSETKKAYEQAILCIQKTVKDWTLPRELERIKEEEKAVLEIVEELIDYNRTISKQSSRIRHPNSKESFYFAETGIDPMRDVPEFNYEAMNNANNRKESLIEHLKTLYRD